MAILKNVGLKTSTIDEIKDNFDGAQGVVVVNYSGLTVEQDTQLRKQLREAGVVYKVYKNTLLRLAFNDLNVSMDDYLEGPTAIVFSSDDIAAVKILSDVAKKNEALELKAGIIEGNIQDKAKLEEFARIPSREGLYTMLAGGMIGIVKDLSIALNLLAEQKEN